MWSLSDSRFKLIRSNHYSLSQLALLLIWVILVIQISPSFPFGQNCFIHNNDKKIYLKPSWVLGQTNVISEAVVLSHLFLPSFNVAALFSKCMQMHFWCFLSHGLTSKPTEYHCFILHSLTNEFLTMCISPHIGRKLVVFVHFSLVKI